jgi:hypothetical protein
MEEEEEHTLVEIKYKDYRGFNPLVERLGMAADIAPVAQHHLRHLQNRVGQQKVNTTRSDWQTLSDAPTLRARRCLVAHKVIRVALKGG